MPTVSTTTMAVVSPETCHGRLGQLGCRSATVAGDDEQPPLVPLSERLQFCPCSQVFGEVPVTSCQPAATNASDSIFLKRLRLAVTVCFGPLSGMT